MLRMVRGTLTPKMPMGAALPAAEIATLEAWVREMPAEAATAKSVWRWPYEKPLKPPVPMGAAHPVDAFILAKLKAKQLSLAPPADRRTLARRVYLDLIGLPPSQEELQAFLNDKAADAYPKLIDRLLSDPRYGERWGRHWLDLVRYGETSGLEGDGAIGNAWRYRDWVIEAFNDDLPYDRFVRDQLAGADEHSKSRNNYAPAVQGHVPLGFLRVAPWDQSNLVADEVRANYLSEVTTATSSIFLGLSVGCARCHDHKYDPIPQRDFYRLQAFFNAVQVENVDVPFRDPEFATLAKSQVEKYRELTKDGPEKKALDLQEQALLPKLAAYKKANAGQELTSADLRLELRRNDHRIFVEPERRRHASLKEDADRTQDPEEKQALESFEAQLMPGLKAAYAQPGFDALGRFDVLTVEDVRTEATRQTSKIFTAAELNRHHELSETLDLYSPADGPLGDQCVDSTQCAGAAEWSGAAAHTGAGAGRLPAAGRDRGGRFPVGDRRKDGARGDRERPLPAVPHARLAHDPGQVDRLTRESAHGARDGEPDLAAALRPGHRGNAVGLRRERRAPDPPRVARLARAHLCRERLERKADAPADADVGHLSAGGREPKGLSGRPRKPYAVALQPAAAVGRGDPGRNPDAERQAEPGPRGPQRLPRPAGRPGRLCPLRPGRRKHVGRQRKG